MLLVKKYPNRRLYDTRNSRYVTLDDLAGIIRKGEDVSVQDAQSNQDLTQEVLMQIILERGGGKLLPSGLLLRLIRLEDASLGEFMTRYVSWALDMYMQVKERTTSLFNRNPIANAPFAAADALARFALDNSPYARFARRKPQSHRGLRRARAGLSHRPRPGAAPSAAVEAIDVNVRMQQIQEQARGPQEPAVDVRRARTEKEGQDREKAGRVKIGGAPQQRSLTNRVRVPMVRAVDVAVQHWSTPRAPERMYSSSTVARHT